MCERYVTPTQRAIEEFWHVSTNNAGIWMPSFNATPTTQVPMLRLDEQATLEVVAARWGLVPEWWGQENPPLMTFSARSEDAWIKPFWHDSIRNYRCLMPATGWFAWSEHEQTRFRGCQWVKQPYYLHAEDRGLLAMAGLWASWVGPRGYPVLSCAVLTKEASAPISYIHPRMPIILEPEQWQLWLSSTATFEQVNCAIAHSREIFDSYPVSTAVDNTNNDYPELVVPLRRSEVFEPPVSES